MNLYSISPFVKWAGGKKQLLEKLIEKAPKQFGNYYEPFIGGGAFLFGMQPQNAVVSDINEQLVNAYNQIKNNPVEVISYVNKFDAIECDKDYYLSMRSAFNLKIQAGILDAECAAMLIWVNKHCFNGLYRVNQKGLFNVPYNNKITGNSIVEENIMGISEYLKKCNVSVLCSDFETTCENVGAGDFVYFDSPYVPESETAYFTDYAKGGFNKEEHERLAELFRLLDKKGALLMLSNNNVEIVHQLYEGFNIDEIDVRRNINSKANKRKGKEVIITNY